MHTIDFYKKQRQYEFLGHKKNKKEMVGDEKLFTFMRGKMAMTSIPRQNTQRGVPEASCLRPADGGVSVVLVDPSRPGARRHQRAHDRLGEKTDRRRSEIDMCAEGLREHSAR